MRAPCSGCLCFSACANSLCEALFKQGKLSGQPVPVLQQPHAHDRDVYAVRDINVGFQETIKTPQPPHD